MQSYPAGLMDGAIEIFGERFKAWCLAFGNRLTFCSFPNELKAKLEKLLALNPKAKAALNDWGIPENEHLERFTFCMYAGFDLIADFDTNKDLSEPEYHNQCGLKGVCSYEGTLCTKHLQVKYGKLSPREIQITRLIGLQYTDRQIAIELNISTETVRNHKNSTERKTGVVGKVGIAVIAHQYRLI